jgi:hypothetical protein
LYTLRRSQITGDYDPQAANEIDAVGYGLNRDDVSHVISRNIKFDIYVKFRPVALQYQPLKNCREMIVKTWLLVGRKGHRAHGKGNSKI